jgi:hypothetical protein
MNIDTTNRCGGHGPLPIKVARWMNDSQLRAE